MKRTGIVLMLVVSMFVAMMAISHAGLPAGCVKVRGQVTCTSFEGPGKNQAGVGTTTTEETQGNLENTSPEPQDLDSGSTCKPSKSKGRPCS